MIPTYPSKSVDRRPARVWSDDRVPELAVGQRWSYGVTVYELVALGGGPAPSHMEKLGFFGLNVRLKIVAADEPRDVGMRLWVSRADVLREMTFVRGGN